MAFSGLLPFLLMITLGSLSACHSPTQRTATRAGVAIGIEARHRAIGIAEDMARIPDVACGTYPLEGPLAIRVVWSLVGDRDGQRQLSVTEDRLLEGDGQGRWRFRRSVELQQASARSGRRDREWRLIDGQFYSKDHNLPFERRPVDVTEVDGLLHSAQEVFETLVELASARWTAVAEPAQGYTLLAEPGQEHERSIRCGRSAHGDPWLGDLAEQARLVRATADVDIDRESGLPVSRQGEWVFEGKDDTPALSLVVQVREEIARGPLVEPIAVPDEVFDATRPRLYRAIENLLGDIDRGLFLAPNRPVR